MSVKLPKYYSLGELYSLRIDGHNVVANFSIDKNFEDALVLDMERNVDQHLKANPSDYSYLLKYEMGIKFQFHVKGTNRTYLCEKTLPQVKKILIGSSLSYKSSDAKIQTSNVESFLDELESTSYVVPRLPSNKTVVSNDFRSTITEHAKFSGVEMTGTKTAFVKKMQQKGYQLVSYAANGAIMKGQFASYSVTIKIAENSKKQVYGVVVEFEDKTSWSDLIRQYDNLKDMYIEKYGNPAQVTENNKNEYTKDNYWLMRSLCEGGCTWENWFSVSEGDIIMSIEGKTVKRQYKEDLYKGHIVIMYRDYKNLKTEKDKRLDDI